jgi:hypothetical protein
MKVRVLTALSLCLLATVFAISHLQSTSGAAQVNRSSGDILHSESVSSADPWRGPQPDGGPGPTPAPLTGANDNKNVRLVGHIGGLNDAIFVRGSYAFAGYGAEMAILDISDRTRPTKISYIVLPDLVQDIYVSGSYAYVAARTTGLRIVDISNVAAPVEVGFYDTPGNSLSVEVVNGFAYVADDTRGLRIIDVSQPAHPREVGAYDTSGLAKQATVSNGYAYVSDFEAGLWIVDVSTPGNPILIGGYDTPWYTNFVYVVGPLAYVLDAHSGLLIVDISTPASPHLLSHLDVGEAARELAVVGRYVYELDSENGLHVIDVADPVAPVQVGHYSTVNAFSLAVTDGYAYLANWYSSELTVLNLAVPTQPVAYGSYREIGYNWGLAVADRYVYASNTMTLTVIDVADPGRPTVVNQVGMPLFPGGWGLGMMIQGHYLYVGDEAGLHVIDLSDPIRPIMVGDYPAFGDIKDLAVAGDRLYMAQTNGLQIIDITTPTMPVQLGLYPVPYAWRLTVAGSYAYVIDQYGLDIVNVLTATSPALIATYPVSDLIQDVAVVGTIAYLVDGSSNQLQIIDVAVPATPALIGSYPIFEDPWAIVADGNYAYVTSLHQCLLVLDVANPARRGRAGYYQLSAPADNTTFTTKIIVDNGYVYIPDQAYGLYILQFASAVSGRVADVNQTLTAGVQIVGDVGQTAVTDGAGTFRLTSLLSGTYAFTPTLPGFRFLPASRAVALPPDAEYQDFTILPMPVHLTLQPGAILPVLTLTDTQALTTQLDFSSVTVTDTTVFVLTPTLVPRWDSLAFAGHAFDLLPLANAGLSTILFHVPVTVTIRYSDLDVRSVSDEDQLALRQWNGSDWEDVVQTCEPAPEYARNVSTNVLSVPICQWGRFALFGPTHQIFLPISFRS